MLYFAPAGADAPFEIPVHSTAATPPAPLLVEDIDSQFTEVADRAADRAGQAVSRRPRQPRASARRAGI